MSMGIEKVKIPNTRLLCRWFLNSGKVKFNPGDKHNIQQPDGGKKIDRQVFS